MELYNQLGLTTQMAFNIKIASRNKRIYINTGALKKATPVKSYAEVTDQNYRLLGFLDAIKDIKNIPDTPIDDIVIALTTKISRLNEKRTKELVAHSLLLPSKSKSSTWCNIGKTRGG